MKAFLRPHRFRHLYPVRFYTTKTQSGHKPLAVAAPHNSGRDARFSIAAERWRRRRLSGPDLSETHRFKRRRLRVRPDEIVFDDACVLALNVSMLYRRPTRSVSRKDGLCMKCPNPR